MVEFDTETFEKDGTRNEKARFAFYMLMCNNAQSAAAQVAPHHPMWALHIQNNWVGDYQVGIYTKMILEAVGGVKAFIPTDDEMEHTLYVATLQPNISFSDRQAARRQLAAFQQMRRDREAAELRANGGPTSILDDIANDGPPDMLEIGEA